MKIFRKISIYISFVALFFMYSTKVFAGTAEAVSYVNTVYSLHLCETGSTASTCKNPLVIRTTPTGTDMDIGSVTAGASAGKYGNLNVLVPGTTYTYGQVVLGRSFTVAGSDGSCQTNASGAAGTAATLALGKSGSGTTEKQVVYAADGTGNGDAMNSTDWKDATTTGDAAAGTLQTGHNYMKFRWELAAPYTHVDGKIPSMKIAFDMSAAITFNGTCGGNTAAGNGISPSSPTITNTIE